MNERFFHFQDFNQTLIFCVFFHLFFLTLFLSMPKPEFNPQKVIPAFMVDLRELLPESGERQKLSQAESASSLVLEKKTSQKPEPPQSNIRFPEPIENIPLPELVPPKFQAHKEQVQILTDAKPLKPEPEPQPNPTSKPVSTKSDKTSVLMEELEAVSPQKEASPKTLLQELDQLAKAELPKPSPRPVAPKAFEENPFQELELLKKKKVAVKPPEVLKKPEPLEKQLKALEFLKSKKIEEIEETSTINIETPKFKGIPEIPNEPVSAPLLPQPDPLNPLQLSKLKDDSEPSSPIVVEPVLTKDDLLRELDTLFNESSSVKTFPEPAQVPTAPATPPAVSEKKVANETNAIQNVLEKLTTREPKRPVAEETTSEAPAEKFVSRVRTLEISKTKKPIETQIASESSSQNAYCDDLCKYYNLIKSKIDQYWQTPLIGIENKVSIVISFYLFREGNIDKPQIKISSGDSALDAQAIKAINDSVPFPKFLPGIRESNLHINMNFKLTPKNE